MIFRNKERNGKSRGSVTMELALATPMLVTVLFGTIEFGSAFVVYQNLVAAASEAARVASQSSCPRPDATRVLSAANEILRSTGLSPDLAQIELANVGGESGTDVVVDVSYDVQFPVLSRLLNWTALSDGELALSVRVEAENE